MTDELAVIEQVVINGDLSPLSPGQRVQYYKQVCQSIGLNPLTKPFDYINLNGKLTLYARKDATDQLRKLHSVSIDDVEITDTDKQFIVKVKGHDTTGRGDVELGVVNKTDMRGDTANALMKAVTKAKRRLTLSICGLGWLDETEVETIPDARPVLVQDNGEIVKTEIPEEVKIAMEFTNSKGQKYGSLEDVALYSMRLSLIKSLETTEDENEKSVKAAKLQAVNTIIEYRKSQ